MLKKHLPKHVIAMAALALILLAAAGCASKTKSPGADSSAGSQQPATSQEQAKSEAPAVKPADTATTNNPTAVSPEEEKRPAPKVEILTEPPAKVPEKVVDATNGEKEPQANALPEVRTKTPEPLPTADRPQGAPIQAKESKPEDFRRTNASGGIEAMVTWLAPEYYAAMQAPVPDEVKENLDKNLVFGISLTTHSGDLSTFDLAGSTMVAVNGQLAGPAAWKWLAQDSHHPDGLLLVPFAGAKVETIQMVIKNLGGAAERKFEWSR